jgi:hypothetical protein
MNLSRCIDLKHAHVEAAMTSREACGALLAHLTYIARPASGAPMMLLVFARMATTACQWVDGDLRVRLRADRDATWVEVLSELAGGLAERVFPVIVVDVPFQEFAGAVARVPKMIAPLTVSASSEDAMTLTASAEVRRTTAPPPMPEIGEASLFELSLPKL